MEGLEETGYITSENALSRAKIPKSLVVIEGSVIALEMAHFYEGLGKNVSLIQRDREFSKNTIRM